MSFRDTILRAFPLEVVTDAAILAFCGLAIAACAAVLLRTGSEDYKDAGDVD